MAFVIRTATALLPGYGMQRFERRQHSTVLDGLVFSVRWLVVAFFLPSISHTSDVMPPVIIKGPAADMIYYQKASLPCVATGTPPLTYEWYRNGQLLKPDSKILLGSDGNLSLLHPDEGFYQCRVGNGAGLAVSSIAHLQPAVLEEMPQRPPKDHVTRGAFDSLLRPCSHILRSVPEAEISWQYDDNEDSRIVPGDRVIVTDDGSLIFTSLLPSDSNRDNASAYKCVAKNSVTGREIGGSYFNLKVTGVSSGGQHGSTPGLIYSSDATVRVLEGKPFSLWCIFSGVNSSGASWQLPNRTTHPPSWRLNFPKAKSSDDGYYNCSVAYGSDLEIKAVKPIRVIVDARPQLEEPVQGQKVQRGDSARFTCRGTGRPPPTVSWLVNGTLYNGTSTEHNNTWHNGFLHQESGTLLIHDARSSASIACNVSNRYGHQLSSSYLIVYDSVYTSSSSSSSSSASPSRSTLTSTLMAFSSSTGADKELANDSSSSTVRPDSTGSGPERRQDENSTGFSLGEYSIPIVVTVTIVLLLIGLIFAVICVLKRRRRTRKYALKKVQDVTLSLKSGEKRGHDGKTWVCDSDDSGYDDFSRNAGPRPKKPLPDPAVLRISRL